MIKMTRLIAFTFMTCSMFSCKKQVQDVVVDTGVTLSVKNSQQKDLLAPGVPDGFSQENIQVFNFINGSYQVVNKPTMDLPKNVKIYKRTNATDYQLDLFVNIETDKDGISKTLIKFGENKPDTVAAKLDRKNGSILLRKVWLNGKEVADRSTPTIVIK